MEFIQATKTDLKTILTLLKKASIALENKNIHQWKYWQNPPKDKVKWLEDGILNNEFFFVHQQSQLIGMFRLLFNDELYWGKQKEIAGYIHSLVIKTEFKGQQFGSKIVFAIEKQLKLKGIQLVRLDCVANNHRLCSYYEKIGFEKVGEVQMPFSLNNLYQKKLG